MKDIKFNEWSLFSIHGPQGVKLISRLRFNFSHLNEHKFRHNVKECVSPLYGCGLEIESTQHFFFRYHFYYIERTKLLNSLYDIYLAVNKVNEDYIINLVLFGSGKYHKKSQLVQLMLQLVLKIPWIEHSIS